MSAKKATDHHPGYKGAKGVAMRERLAELVAAHLIPKPEPSGDAE